MKMITLFGISYSVRFDTDKKPENKKEKWGVTCTILDMDSNVVSIGRAECSKKDTFVRTIGENIALHRALEVIRDQTETRMQNEIIAMKKKFKSEVVEAKKCIATPYAKAKTTAPVQPIDAPVAVITPGPIARATMAAAKSVATVNTTSAKKSSTAKPKTVAKKPAVKSPKK